MIDERRPVRVPYPAPPAELPVPVPVTVVGQPARGRDELVRALGGCPLLRLRVAAGLRPDQPVLVPAGARVSPWRPGARPAVVVLRTPSPARDVRALASTGETAPVLVVSAETDEAELVRTVRSGATSYLVEGLFTPAEAVAATLGTAAGRSHLSAPVLAAVVGRLRQPDGSGLPAELAGSLSRRERQIMELVAEGHPNSYIARREFIAEKTVRNHLNNIYAKLSVRSRSEAILVWLGRTPAAAG